MLTKKLSEIVSLIRNGKLTAGEVCEECVRRMRATRVLNCFISETPAIAAASASDIDQIFSALSPTPHKSTYHPQHLLGIPVAIKDNFSTKGIRTTCGSSMLQHYTPPFDATVVHNLLSQGSLLVGKTNMDEFAMGSGSTDSAFGPVKNPWNYLNRLQSSRDGNNKEIDFNKRNDHNINNSSTNYNNIRNNSNNKNNINVNNNNINNNNNEFTNYGDDDFYIAGGSSGGSAVAVAVAAAFVGIGSDTGGSTRNPSAYCGVVGLKPSYGRCSRHGLIPLVNSMDVPGIITRSVDDAATVLNCLSGHDTKDSTTVREVYEDIMLPERPSVEGLTIGIPKEYHCPGLDAGILEAWMKKADEFERGGAKVVGVEMPHTQLSINCYHVLCDVEVASNMARYDGLRYGERGRDETSSEAMYAQSRRENFNDVVRSRILAGNYFLLKNNYHKYYMRALKVRRLITEDFKRLRQSGVDLLLTPTVISPAPLYDSFSHADNRTRTAEQDLCTQPVNMAGVPAINVPVSLSENGMPIGLQLIGQYLREDQLLLAAKFLEQNSNFPHLFNQELFKD